MPLVHLLIELCSRGVRLGSQDGNLWCEPAGALDQALREELIRHKAKLLKLLGSSVTQAKAEGHADREWRRFWSVAKPWPDGSGWYDPQAMTPALFKWLNNSSNN